MTYVLATIFVLGVLVFVHEFGHFIMAKLFGIRVEKFSLGFGPRMVGKTVGETEYRISWIPLGGYCKMAGMVDESLESGSVQGKDWEFQSKPALVRLVVIVAGPAMNFLLALVLLIAIGLVWGRTEAPSRVGEVEANMPAAEAGLQAGDLIVALDGHAIQYWSQLTDYIRARPGQRVQVDWVHNGQRRSATLIPQRDEVSIPGKGRETIGRIGILVPDDPKDLIVVPLGFTAAVADGYHRTVDMTSMVVGTVKLLITGQESIQSLGGPIFIGKLAGESAEAGMMPLLIFMAFLSINLGLLNLLPMPVLDGGHVVFIVIEGITRRALPIKVKLVILQIGFFLLVALMIFIIYNDVTRLFVGAQ